MGPYSKTHARAISPSLLDQLAHIDEALGYHRHLAHVRTFVDGRTNSAVTLVTAAHAVGVSQSHLARLFQENIGISFHLWLTLRRVRTAMNLMTERPITGFEVAHLSGFASYRSFARAFKDVAGISPSAYRKQVKQVVST